jgi:hypothetical protein
VSAEQTVTDIINDARTFATESYANAEGAISGAQSAAGSTVYLTPRSLNFDAPDPIEFDDPGDPGAFEDGFNLPGGRPTSPSGDLVGLHIPELPVFPDPPPDLDTGGLFDIDRPQFNIGAFTEPAPVVDTNITLPDAPELQQYEAPETSPLDLRPTPSVDGFPTFDPGFDVSSPGEAPDVVAAYKARLEEMTPQFRDWVETYADAWIDRYAPEYHNAMAQLEERLAASYAGGTAMPDTVEQQIFDRGVSRAERERGNLDNETIERWSRRGYALPPIALNSQLAANQRQVARSVADVAREVAIERARLEHQHIQFVMQISSTMRDAMRNQVISYSGVLLNINGQALEDSRTIGGYLVEVYRLLLEKSRNDQEHLRTLTQIFETQLKSSLVDLEIFKIEADVAKTRKDAELADVEVWAKKIDAENAKINLYLAQLKGISEQVGVERLKVDIYGEQVQAYAQLVRSKEAEFNAYRAAISGDEALVKAYSEQVRAYGQQVDAAKVKVQAESAITDAGVQYNRGLIDIFKSDLSAWEAELDGEGKRFDGSASAYRTRLELYKTRINAQLEQQRSVYDGARLDLAGRTEQTRADVQTLLAQANLLQQRINLVANTGMSAAEAYGAMASSAMSAQNTMVNLVNETLNGA